MIDLYWAANRKEICNAKIGIPNDFPADDRYLLEFLTTKKSNEMLCFAHREHHIVLQTSSGMDVAILDRGTTEALKSLSNLRSVRFEVFPAVDGLIEGAQVWKKKGKIAGITVKINIYGDRNVIKIVGKNLSKAGVYLQH